MTSPLVFKSKNAVYADLTTLSKMYIAIDPVSRDEDILIVSKELFSDVIAPLFKELNKKTQDAIEVELFETWEVNSNDIELLFCGRNLKTVLNIIEITARDLAAQNQDVKDVQQFISDYAAYSDTKHAFQSFLGTAPQR